MQTNSPIDNNNHGLSLFVKDLIAGGFSGVVAKTVTAPIERVKLIMQTQRSNSRIHSGQYYRGGIHCIQQIYENEGFLALWRGNFANVLRYFPNQAINFALKDKFRAIFGQWTSDANRHGILAGNFLSGGAAGATSALLIYPLDVARTRLATDVVSAGTSSGRQFSGVADSIVKCYQEGGIKRVYRGFAVSLTGAVVFRTLFFGGYDNLKYSMDLEHSSRGTRYIVAQTLTTIVGTLCYPIDTIKRRMMIQVNFLGSNVTGAATSTQGYMNGRECLRYVLSTEGWRGLYAGLPVNIVRGISGALLLVCYDDIKKFMK